jgi:hypothetical protein
MKRLSRTTLLIMIAAILTGFGSCSRTLDQACHRHFPKVEGEMAALGDQLGQGGRSLASLEDSEKRSRQKWALALLQETQEYIDMMMDEPELKSARQELSRAANHLVALYGHLGSNRGKPASDTLEKVRRHTLKARDLACKR